MQLPAGEELVLVSGLAPIRARKLRYFEDRRFAARVAAAPALGGDVYADRPPQRSDDWAGLRAEPVAIAPPVEGEERGGEGGLQQQRHPELSAEILPALPTSSDPLGLDEDWDDGLAAAPLFARMRLAPLVAADGINQGSDRGCDPMPSF
jgi:type IV secretion system protein VirD4